MDHLNEDEINRIKRSLTPYARFDQDSDKYNEAYLYFKYEILPSRYKSKNDINFR